LRINPANDLSWKASAVLVLKGMCMGIADVIPGISGGTIAFILGIYERLIYSVRSFDLQFVRLMLRFRLKEAFAHASWQFLGSVVLGIGTSIVVCSHLISYLLEHFPVFVHAFFFGLIMATVPIMTLIIKRWNYQKVFWALFAGIVTYFLVAMSPVTTPQSWWFLFLCGFVAISAMILPGISGAFILVLLSKYEYVINAVKDREILTLLVFGSGVLCGIVSFVRVLGWLLKKWHDMTVAVLTGIVVGSLNKIWPWKETIETIVTRSGKVIPVSQVNIVPVDFSAEVAAALALMAAGFVLALILSGVNKNKKLL
jgi:putative membrane protein